MKMYIVAKINTYTTCKYMPFGMLKVPNRVDSFYAKL